IQPSIQDILRQAEEDFGPNHPTSGLTIPCCGAIFADLAYHLGLLEALSKKPIIPFFLVQYNQHQKSTLYVMSAK
ncbi:Auxin responsive SAUR protein, partial [Cynara cardunculus var. scolymus]